MQQGLRNEHQALEKENLSGWDFGELEQFVEYKQGAITIRAYPGLCREEAATSLRMFDNPLEASYQSRRSLALLAKPNMIQTVRYLRKELLRGRNIGLSVVDMGTPAEVVEQIINASIDQMCFAERPLPTTQKEFEYYVESGKADIVERCNKMEKLLLDILQTLVEIKALLKTKSKNLSYAFAMGDINTQLSNMFYPNMLSEVPYFWLQQYPRYLSAIDQRLEKVALNVQKDRLLMAEVQESAERVTNVINKYSNEPWRLDEKIWEYRWMTEELRVSLFAQTLGTVKSVSSKRLNKMWQDIEQGIN